MEGKNRVSNLISNLKEYTETRFDLTVLNIQDKVSDRLSSIASVAVIAVLGMLILFLISIGGAWWIGQSLNNPSIGFFCVAGFYLVLAVIIYFNRNNWIKLPIINGLLKKININEQD